MKIALFTDTYLPQINGVATSCYTLAKTLQDHGHSVLVVTTNPFSKDVTYDRGIIRIPGIEMKSLYGYIMSGVYNAKAFKYIKDFGPDVIHFQTEFGIGIFANKCAKKLHVPTVYTYHTMWEEYAYYITKGAFDRAARGFVRQALRNYISNVDAFVTPSEKTKDYIRRIGIDTYVNVIPTGIDFKKFYPENISLDEVKAIKDKFGIKDNVFTVLSLGRVAKEKSIDFVMEGYKAFLKKYKDIESQLVIVGDGPAREDLIVLSKTMGIDENTIFTGYVSSEEVQKYYAVGNAFASASLSETQGLTYMEAMAAHKYVLARYDHNLLDVINEGKTGYFFETPEEFADKLKVVYDKWKNNDSTMLVDAIKSIDNYSIDTFYERIIEVYNRVIKKHW